MKRFFYFWLVVIVVFGALYFVSKEVYKMADKPKEEIDDGLPKFTVEGFTFKLKDKKELLGIMSFLDNSSEFTSETVGTTHKIKCRRKAMDLFEIKIINDTEHEVDRVINMAKKSNSVKINDYSYSYIEYENKDGLNEHTYGYVYDNISFLISFISKYDTKNLEEVFLSNVSFKDK